MPSASPDRRRWALGLAGAAVIVVAGAVGVAAQWSPFDEERDRRRPAPVDFDQARVDYDGRFAFVRLRYHLGGGRGGFGGFRREPPWAHDYPRADRHLMKILSEITLLRPHMDDSNIFTLDDPELHRYPVAYMSEPGYWTLNDAEAEGLRTYLAKGGFLIFDDFRQEHWYNFEAQLRKVLPDQRLIPLDASHPDLPRLLRDRPGPVHLALRRADPDLPRHLRGQRPDPAPAGHRQLRQRPGRVLGVLGHRLGADRPVQRGLQVRRELHRVRYDALDRRLGRGSGSGVEATRTELQLPRRL